MNYKCATKLHEIQDYLGGASIVAFDFETSPDEKYRNEDKAALDAHKASITGISFSVSEGTAVYVPFRHRTGQNAKDQPKIWKFLKTNIFMSPNIIKVAHNLSFESMFLYAQGIVLQPPCYDTIAASQLTLKNKMQYRSLSDSGLKTLVPELFGVNYAQF